VSSVTDHMVNRFFGPGYGFLILVIYAILVLGVML